jgi:hypothetical protein
MDRYPAALIDRILRQTIGDRDRIGMPEVAAARIPQGIKAFLRADVHHRLREDAAQTRWIRGLLARPGGSSGEDLGHMLASEFVFTTEDYAATVGNAVHFLGNYLCRPRSTLGEFIYHDRESAGADHIRRMLEHCADYPYLTGLIAKYLDRKDIQELSVEAFNVLVGKMDDLFLQRLSAEEHVRLTLPLFEYFELAGQPDEGAPVQALAAFFGEKHLERLIASIRKPDDGSGGGFITFPALRAMVREESGAPPAEPRRERPPDRETGEEEDAPAGAPEEPTVAAGETPPPPPQEPQAVPGSRRLDLANAALALTFAGMQKPPGLPSLESLMTPAQREVFIRKVFHRDPDYFAAVVKALDRIGGWDEAADYLRRLYEAIGLDPFMEDVVRFTDVVHSRYTGDRP